MDFIETCTAIAIAIYVPFMGACMFLGNGNVFL